MQLNAEGMEDADEAARELDVLGAWIRRGRRVVVRDDDRLRVDCQRATDNFAKWRKDLMRHSVSVAKMAEHMLARIEQDTFQLFEIEGRKR
jgi:hypothetical protein